MRLPDDGAPEEPGSPKAGGAASRGPGYGIDVRFALIAAGVVGIILYGSLYPFRFVDRLGGTGALITLLDSWRDPALRSDVVANVLLYLPLGLFGVQSLRGMSAGLRIALVALAGMALSTGVELLQYYDRFRITNMSDVYSNTTGALFGAIGGALLHRDASLPLVGRIGRRRFVVLVLASWIGFRMFPYALAPDLGESWARRLLPLRPEISRVDTLEQFVTWLMLALLAEALVGKERGRWTLIWMLPAFLFTRSLMAGRTPSASEAVGGAAAAIVWAAVLWRLRLRAPLVASLFGVVLVAQSLAPFTFLAEPRHFSLVPFRSFIRDTRENAVRSFFEKTFTYGALVWSTMRVGLSWTASLIACGVLVLSLRIAQVYLPNRSAEITDVVMLLILAAVLKLMHEDAPAN